MRMACLCWSSHPAPAVALSMLWLERKLSMGSSFNFREEEARSAL
jgi:hypothetical protein